MTLGRAGGFGLPHDAVDQFSVAATGARMHVPQQLRPPPFASQGRVIGHGNIWAPRGSHLLQPQPLRVPGPVMGQTPKTMGFLGELFGAVATGIDVIAGGPQKRERAARAQAAAEQASAEAQVRSALINAETQRQAGEQALELEKTKGKTMIVAVGAAGMIALGVALIATRKRK